MELFGENLSDASGTEYQPDDLNGDILSRATFEQLNKRKKQPLGGLAKQPSTTREALEEPLPPDNMKDSGDSTSLNAMCPEVTDTKGRAATHDRTQGSMTELEDDIGIYQDTSVSITPLSTRTSITTSSPPSIAENGNYHIQNQGEDPEQATSSPTLLPVLTNTKVLIAGQPQNKAHSPENCVLQCQVQLNLHSTQVIKIEKRGDNFISLQQTPSIDDAATCYSPPPYPSTTERIDTGSQRTTRMDYSTHLLDPFNTPLPLLPSLLPPLPPYLRPENRCSPRPFPNARPHISFATAATHYNSESGTMIETPLKMSTAHKIYRKASKNQGIFDRNLTKTHESFYSFTNKNEGGRVFGVSKRHSELVIRDFSLPSSIASPNALVNPYDIEVAIVAPESIADAHISTYAKVTTYLETDANTDGFGAETGGGGWLASNKQAHRRAIAQYLAAAVDKTPATLHPSASIESVATITETRAFDNVSATAGIGDSIVSCVGSSDGESTPKATFLERCGKALNKKRSFWKKGG
ncbi:hypothetical protein F5Y09DRAFT_344559 [Xylaria sp. FL1042]|nr:hypothetical protein F5Y09DRAFT_344559 [Xylaria sp. FL1042]